MIWWVGFDFAVSLSLIFDLRVSAGIVYRVGLFQVLLALFVVLLLFR